MKLGKVAVLFAIAAVGVVQFPRLAQVPLSLAKWAAPARHPVAAPAVTECTAAGSDSLGSAASAAAPVDIDVIESSEQTQTEPDAEFDSELLMPAIAKWESEEGLKSLPSSGFTLDLVDNSATPDRVLIHNINKIAEDEIEGVFDGLDITDRADLATKAIDILCSPLIDDDDFPTQLEKVRYLISAVESGVCEDHDDEDDIDTEDLNEIPTHDDKLHSNMPIHFVIAVEGILSYLTETSRLKGEDGSRCANVASKILFEISSNIPCPISAQLLGDIVLSLVKYRPIVFRSANLRRTVLRLPQTPVTDQILDELLRVSLVDECLLSNVAYRTTHAGYLQSLRTTDRRLWLRLYRRRHLDAVFVYGAARALDLLLGHLPDFAELRDQIVLDLAAHTIPSPSEPFTTEDISAGRSEWYLPDDDLFKGVNQFALLVAAFDCPHMETIERVHALRRIRAYRDNKA